MSLVKIKQRICILRGGSLILTSSSLHSFCTRKGLEGKVDLTGDGTHKEIIIFLCVKSGQRICRCQAVVIILPNSDGRLLVSFNIKNTQVLSSKQSLENVRLCFTKPAEWIFVCFVRVFLIQLFIFMKRALYRSSGPCLSRSGQICEEKVCSRGNCSVFFYSCQAGIWWEIKQYNFFYLLLWSYGKSKSSGNRILNDNDTVLNGHC